MFLINAGGLCVLSSMGEQPPCIAEDVGSIPAGYVAYGQKTIVSHKGKIKNSLFIELI